MSHQLGRLLRFPAVFLLLGSAAFAHPMKAVGDFYAGMLHPLTTIDTVLPLIALSMLAGQQSRETAMKVLASFPAALALGTTLVLFASPSNRLPAIELVLTAVCGLLLALARPLPAWLALTLAVLVGIGIGWANAAEVTTNISAARFSGGLVLVGLLIATYGVGLVRSSKLEWTQVAVRVVGSWLAAVGILVLGLR